jgi:hypothetical protein
MLIQRDQCDRAQKFESKNAPEAPEPENNLLFEVAGGIDCVGEDLFLVRAK